MQSSHLKRVFERSSSEGEGTLLTRIDRGATMDPVTSPLIHKDSGRQARVDPGEENPSHPCERSYARRRRKAGSGVNRASITNDANTVTQ
jgi:hypothetical protein